MQDAVKDLTDTLEEAASETGAVTGLVESISKAMNEVGLSLLVLGINIFIAKIASTGGRVLHKVLCLHNYFLNFVLSVSA